MAGTFFREAHVEEGPTTDRSVRSTGSCRHSSVTGAQLASLAQTRLEHDCFEMLKAFAPLHAFLDLFDASDFLEWSRHSLL